MSFKINKKSEELKEEKVHTPSDWTHEDIDLNIQSYNVSLLNLYGVKIVQKTAQESLGVVKGLLEEILGKLSF